MNKFDGQRPKCRCCSVGGHSTSEVYTQHIINDLSLANNYRDTRTRAKMMSETYKLLDSALESARAVYEHDTEVTVKQLETIRQVNTATTLNYIKKEEALKRVTRKADSIEAKSM